MQALGAGALTLNATEKPRVLRPSDVTVVATDDKHPLLFNDQDLSLGPRHVAGKTLFPYDPYEMDLVDMVFDHVVPRLLTGQAVSGELGIEGYGRPARFDIRADSSEHAVTVTDGHKEVRVSVGQDAVQIDALCGLQWNGGRNLSHVTLTVPPQSLITDTQVPVRMATSDPQVEKWLLADAKSGAVTVSAQFKRAESPAADGIPRCIFSGKIPSETGTERGGFVHSNEVVGQFPDFAVRGGAYFGIGGAQNYDLLTTAKSDLVFLVDRSPAVTRFHRGMLALIGTSSDATELTSWMAGVRLTEREKNLEPEQLLRSFFTEDGLGWARPVDTAFRDQVYKALRERLSGDDAEAAMAVLKDHSWGNENGESSSYLLCWASELIRDGDNKCRWLLDADRYKHLQTLQRHGRIFLSTADITGNETLPALAQQLQSWNQRHYPQVRFNVMYLSNVPSVLNWARMEDGPKDGLEKMQRNLSALPLSPHGVVLSTTYLGGDDEFSGPAEYAEKASIIPFPWSAQHLGSTHTQWDYIVSPMKAHLLRRDGSVPMPWSVLEDVPEGMRPVACAKYAPEPSG